MPLTVRLMCIKLPKHYFFTGNLHEPQCGKPCSTQRMMFQHKKTRLSSVIFTSCLNHTIHLQSQQNCYHIWHT